MSIGSSGNGKPSSQSTGMSAKTVVGNVRNGAQKASANSMPMGAGGGAKKGMRATYLGNGVPSNVDGVSVVTAGTVASSTGPAKGGSVTASAPAFKGQDAPKTYSPSAKAMKTGAGGGAKKGMHKGYL